MLARIILTLYKAYAEADRLPCRVLVLILSVT